MRVKLVPRQILAVAEQEHRLLCLHARGLGPRQISFLTGLPLSTVYRKLAKLEKLGMSHPGIYVAAEMGDGNLGILERPVLIITENYCAYFPESCEYDSCLKCPQYAFHLKALHAMGLVEGQYAEPRHLVNELVARVKEAVSRGVWVELPTGQAHGGQGRRPRGRRLITNTRTVDADISVGPSVSRKTPKA